MRNIIKKTLFLVASCMLASVAMMAQTPAIALTAKTSTIDDWNKTYDNVTISVQGAALAGKKPCGATEKENTLSISSSDSHWIEISCKDGLSKVIITGAGNNSGTADYYAPLCVCSSAPFDNTITGIIEVHYTGYDQECIENEIDLPEGTKSVRLYRRMKVNSAGTEVGSGSNWTPSSGTGNQTYNITYLAAYAGKATATSDPVGSVTILGPDAIFVGQKASFGASPDVKADAFKWTVDGIEQEGATSVLFEFTPSAAGTYAIQAFAKNSYNTDWIPSNIINLVASEKTELQQVAVSATTVWDWTKAGTGSIEWKAETTPRKDKDTILLANVEGINNNAEFNSQALRFAGQYPIRDGKYCQGPWISFKTSVAGYVQVEFSNTGSKDVARYIAVNGVVNTEVGSLNTTAVTSANIAVDAGDVVIEGSLDPYEAQYVRIYKISFNTGEIPVEKSKDNTLKSLTYNGTSVPGFSPSTLTYNIELPAETTEVPVVEAVANDEKASAFVMPATSLPGTTTIMVTAENGDVAYYKITFTVEGTEPPATVAVTGVTLNKTATTINVGSSETLTATVAPSDATNQNISWSSNKESVATVANGVVTAKAEGTATITVKTEDGDFTATCAVTVKKQEETPDVPVPSTGLTTHEPGIYEETAAKGGYDAALSVFGGREYEVFYAGRYEEKVDGTTKKGLTIQVNPPTDKTRGITTNEDESKYEAADGWFKGSGKDKGTGFAEKEEFTATERCHTLKSNSIELHIKGYDQFSLYGADKKVEPSKPQNNKVFKVTINGVEQEMPISTDQTIRRFDISTGEQVILIESGDDCLFGGFSLRVAQIPSVKYLRGNDSTQVVPQTENLPRAITYYTKYNKLGETRVVWEDKEATGIGLTVKGSDGIGDTLVLSGQALCEVGVYPFHVSSFYNGVETKRLPSGKFTVTSDIRAIGEPKVEVYQDEVMEELEFSYHALSADDITLTWTNGTPAGVTGHGEDGKYYISGTPTQVGEFTFTISVKGGNSIEGLVSVKELVIGDNPVLYLYTNADAYKQDGIITYLTTKGYDFVPRKAKRDGLRPTEDYKKYKWVLISEDANADNAEVLALTQESSILPVLNMKSFSYAKERLGWGDPNNGGLNEPDARYITVQRDDHPIFKNLNKSKGSKIEVLSKIDEKGLMPIDINRQGTFCLATALTRAKEDYYENGDPQTFLHEVPAAVRGGKKYICMPIAMSSSNNLTTAGKQLVEAVVNYLLNNEPSIQKPELQITSFIINGIAGKFEGDKIIFEIDLAEHTDIDKYAITPQVTVASDYTHVTPASGKTIDFSESWSYPVKYEVSDYINRRVYDVAIRFFSSEGIEDVYAVGDWVNIYDIFGRKVSTTNEDIYHMVLPRGIYVIVTETGETFKIMR